MIGADGDLCARLGWVKWLDVPFACRYCPPLTLLEARAVPLMSSVPTTAPPPDDHLSQAWLAALMASTPDHIYVKDRDSRFVWVSASLARSFGCTPGDIIGRTDADFFDAQRAGAYRTVELDMMSTGIPVLDKIVEHRWPDGHVTYSLNVAMPVHDAAGDIIGVWGTNKDITQQKLTERALEERTRELEKVQSALVNAAREAGMAEIATNVLHNVGNVLNSVVVSTGLIGARLRESKTKGFVGAMRLMDEHGADLGNFLSKDERGKLLPNYLQKLVATLTAERTYLLEELESLNKGLDHIRDIVTTQQSYARAPTSVVEPLLMSDLLEDALRMNFGSLARREVSVVKHWPNVPEALLDKHLILQIIVNLVGNAIQAMEAVTDRPRRLTLRAEKITAPSTQAATHTTASDAIHPRRGRGQRRRHPLRKPRPPLHSRLHHAQEWPRLRPAQLRPRREGDGSHHPRPQRRTRQGCPLHPRPTLQGPMNTLDNRRILLVDDMAEIHADFRKILARETGTAAASAGATLVPTDADLEADEAILFGAQKPAKHNPPSPKGFDMDSAFQGEEALEKVRTALTRESPLRARLHRHAHAARVGRG